MTPGSLRVLRIYIAVLVAVLFVILARSPLSVDLSAHDLVGWIGLTLLFAATEHAFTSVYDEKSRFGLSASEAVLLPMLIGLPFAEVVWAVVVAGVIVRSLQWREGALKAIFNVASFGVAAAVAAASYSWLLDVSGSGLPIRLIAAVEAVSIYALSTHLFASIISVCLGRSFLELSRTLGIPTMLNLVGSISMGVLFGAAYAENHWTVAVFPLPLAALFLGYRAVLRQRSETERMEHLHAASRALASGRDLDESLLRFLASVSEVASAAEARVVLRTADGLVEMSVRNGESSGLLTPVESDSVESLERLLEFAPITMNQESSDRSILHTFDRHSLAAVPIVKDEETMGCLIVLDRVGAGEFKDPELTLLEALAIDLMLTLESYKLFESVLQERERFARIFEGSTEGICLLDDGGVVVAWNPALESITGYSQDELLGRVWSDVLTLRYSTQKRVGPKELVRVDPDVELELVTRAGPTRWISVMAGGVAAGDKDAYVVLVRDRSAEREAEEAKSDFLATISHELRTPLTTIKGALQMLSRTGPDLPPSTQQQMFTLMKRGSDRLERLVMNLLFVSQIESSGDVQMFSDEFSLEEIVQERIETVLSDHGEVYVDVEARDIEVRADRERLGLALEHIFDNARKFAGEGRITVQVTRDNGYATVSVADHGPGIAQVDQERIFERFTRLGQVLTRETQGAGVGLFIAKRSVEAMGGFITVESEPGAGATFHVTVPLARPMLVAEESSG